MQAYEKVNSKAWKSGFIIWKPYLKKNAYQMSLIEDWLIDQGCGLKFEVDQCGGKGWFVLITVYAEDPLNNDYYSGADKSKSIAFMKAFMEYQTAK